MQTKFSRHMRCFFYFSGRERFLPETWAASLVLPPPLESCLSTFILSRRYQGLTGCVKINENVAPVEVENV